MPFPEDINNCLLLKRYFVLNSLFECLVATVERMFCCLHNETLCDISDKNTKALQTTVLIIKDFVAWLITRFMFLSATTFISSTSQFRSIHMHTQRLSP